MMRPQIAVIGGGIIGVSSAFNIINSLPNSDVTIIAEEWTPNTTGDGSAGFIYPYLLGNTPEDKIIQWFKDTSEFLKNYCISPNGGSAGIGNLSSYLLSEENEFQIPEYTKDLIGMHVMTPKELQMFPEKYKSGALITTYFAECTKLLPLMMSQFTTKGGKMINKRVNDIRELRDHYDIIVNCTGVQSNKLVGDERVYPIRGQVIRVIAPWIKHGVMAGNSYILPNSDTVILGGTKQKSWDRNVDADDRKRIIDGCCSIFPSLKAAVVVKDWVGLRPGRDEVRLQLETIEEKDKKLYVIHNYGHGGSGVTLFWGCSNDVLRMVKDVLNTQTFNYQSVSKL